MPKPRYPVYGENGSYLGEMTFKQVRKSYPNRWILDHGIFRLHRVADKGLRPALEKEKQEAFDRASHKKASGGTQTASSKRAVSRKQEAVIPPPFPEALLRRAPSSTTTKKHGTGNPESLIGGIRASGIVAKKDYNKTPVPSEPDAIRKRSDWKPPVRDTSRFSGSSSSRHKAASSYKGSSDSHEYFSDWISTKEEREIERLFKVKKIAARKQNLPTSSKKSVVPKTGPLSAKELKTLDNNYRIHGANPSWKGWSKLLPGRSREVLMVAAREHRLDRPVASWTKGELSVFRQNSQRLGPHSAEWRKLLPRKSEAHIIAAYRDGLA